MTGNTAPGPGKSVFPGLRILALLLALLGIYVLSYHSARNVFLIDNVFLVFEYPGEVRSAYRLIEFYRDGGSENLAGRPVDDRTPLTELDNGTTLNLDAASRSVEPPGFHSLPLLFYPLERLDIIFRIEPPAAGGP